MLQADHLSTSCYIQFIYQWNIWRIIIWSFFFKFLVLWSYFSVLWFLFIRSSNFGLMTLSWLTGSLNGCSIFFSRKIFESIQNTLAQVSFFELSWELLSIWAPNLECRIVKNSAPKKSDEIYVTLEMWSSFYLETMSGRDFKFDRLGCLNLSVV